MNYDEALAKAFSGDVRDLGIIFFPDLVKSHVTAHFKKDPKTGKLIYIHDYDDSRHKHELHAKYERGDRVKNVNVKSKNHHGKEGVFHSYDEKHGYFWVKFDGDTRPTALAAHHVEHLDESKKIGNTPEDHLKIINDIQVDTPFGISTLGKAFRDDLIKDGTASIIGHEVNGPDDLAAAAQVWRDPRYESLRLVYVKNGKVVGHDGVTQRLPGSVKAFAGTYEEERDRIKKRLKTLGADGFFMLHNHPSGNPTPSEADKHMTRKYSLDFPELRGHVVINSGKYAFIYPKSLTDGVSIRDLKLPPNWKDELLSPSTPHPFLGKEAGSTAKIAEFGKKLHESGNKLPKLLYLDSGLKIRGIQDVSRDTVNGPTDDWLPEQMRSFGVSVVALYDHDLENQGAIYRSNCEHLVKGSYFVDIVGGNTSILAEVGSPASFGSRFAGKSRADFPIEKIKYAKKATSQKGKK